MSKIPTQKDAFSMQGMNFSDKEEIVRFVSENGIRILNLCHIPEDGRLRTLSFSVSNKDRVYEILDFGERVDGSNLFSFITPGKSDIYIVPKCDKGIVNPFSTVPALNLLCRYLDENGRPLDAAPESVMTKAEEKLRSSTDVVLKALAELEFYIIYKQQGEMLFPGDPEKNYHDSSPFTKFEWLRNEILVALTSSGIGTKYGHSEVGRLLCRDNTLMEQHEVEFAPQNLAEMAETITIAKWIIRNVCARHGISVSFCPKIALEHAGTGMHIHLCGLKNGENIVANHKGTLTVEAKKMIGGMLRFAPSLAAFGNPTPPSYLRFTARKESPMHICWSARNRLALIRIPLWWSFKRKGTDERDACRETFEYRAPDAFANAYLLFAGIAVAINYGLKNSKESLDIADKLHIEETADRRKKLKLLPRSCTESARNLRKDRKFYEADDVFPKKVIDKTIEKLNAYKDENLWKNLAEKPEKVGSMLRQYLHYG